MYKDIISYELAENTTEQQLLNSTKQVLESWMEKQPGFLKWEIHSNRNGHYTDIVYWASREDAQAAEKEMVNIPNGAAWFACYKEGTIKSENITLISSSVQ